MLLVTNRCVALKDLLFFDQSDKSPDSGLQVTTRKCKFVTSCCYRYFNLLLIIIFNCC